jgi:hypothetical protein
VLVAALTGLGGAALFVIEVDSNAGVVTIEALARPDKRVSTATKVPTSKGSYQASLLPSQIPRLP